MTQKGECGNSVMKNSLLLFMVCQVSATILDEAEKTQKNIFESNKNNLSPKEKIQYENKIRLFNIFGKFLRYGSAVYLVLSIILEIIGTLIK